MKKAIIGVGLVGTLCAPAAWLVQFGIAKGWPAGKLALFGGIGLLCGLGLIVLVGGPLFLIWRLAGAAPPRLPLAPDEIELLSLPALNWAGLEARAGTLTVTTRRLLFHSHRVNFQRHPLGIELATIDGARAVFGGKQLLVGSGATTSSFVLRSPSAPAPDVDGLARLLMDLAIAPETDRPRIVEAYSNLR